MKVTFLPKAHRGRSKRRRTTESRQRSSMIRFRNWALTYWPEVLG